MKTRNKILIIIALVAIIGIYSQLIAQNHEHFADDNTGYIIKHTYDYYNSDKCIILIAGIHPREKLAIDPEIKAADEFAKTNNIKMIVYEVHITKDADDYSKSRYNGEHIIAKYVNSDVIKYPNAPVIISHSHKPGYGEGFYVATPAMDEKSVEIANHIKDNGFNYYPVLGNEEYNSTSAKLVSKPIANSGNPTLVYEIPENITEYESTKKACKLFKLCN